uniref:Small nuclear RNA activating complex polypeptide 4 n=1 Tax=Varanus komodoensis TaxID=61221 RepID=A0A8D2Q888_VARKO
MDINAEREKIRLEIQELERSLGPSLPCTEVQVSDSSLESASDDGADQEQEGGVVIYLPHTPETCLQMNLVYQEVIQEKMVEINLLLAQNKEQQEKLMWELAGTRGTKSGSRKTLPANMFLGHFMKPYFKDKTSGIGPPANSDAHEKARQGIKSFEELITIKCKGISAKCSFLSSGSSLLPEEALLGSKSDEHDWDKIANISFEGTRSGKELRKYWQNSEHPSINKKEWGEEELARLKEVAARHRFVGWEAVAQELGTRRTAFQCLQKFQAYNKDFKRSEWAPEEDQMLLHLVQEMRVGSHIPYRKIAYYMEGRNSAQLIYRWTKCVDPNLKRGAWTPREDALLLKAVAKYGPRDWYKIRAEVPGRTDTQCRDRYLHALHYDIKKGKWSEEEERKLVELTEKYGVGHWAKIAAELPHRSGSQCLSKWKVLLGYRPWWRPAHKPFRTPSPAPCSPLRSARSLPCPAQHSLQTSAPHPGKRLVPLKAKEGPAPASSRAARCSGSAPKPKTVSELLREKRLREAKVKKAEQRRLLLTAPPLLLPSSVIIRPQGPPAAQGLSSLQGTPSGQVSLLPAALPVAASTPPVPPSEMDRVPPQATSRNVCETAVVSRERADAPRNGAPHGHRGATPPSQANASFPAPQASVGGPPGPSPSLDPAGTGDPSSSSSSPAAAAAAAAPQPGSGALPKAVLPITWVLTPQGLIPMTIVSLPSQGKLPVGAPGAPPQLGQGTVATSPQAPAVGAVLATGGSSQAPPGARVQERLSGSPQPSGVVQQAASAPSSQPLPAHPRGLSESLPTTCPPASPSHGASSRSTRPVSPAGAAPALAHPSQVVGNPPPLAPPQPGKAPPGPEAQPPAPHEHKLSPDYGLLSQEDPAAVKGWVSAGAAAHLPCLPPFLCSLRTVGALLLNKEALERTAAPLVAPGGRPDGLGQAGLSALRGLVRQQLGANPAYQLLRSRFLAAFTFPAALAALPPCRVTTTLSGGRWWESSSGEDSSPSEEGEEEEEEEEEEDDDNDEAAEESQKTTLDEPGRTADTSKEQEVNTCGLEGAQ